MTKTCRKPSLRKHAERPPQLRRLIADDVRAKVAVGPQPVPLLANLLREVKHDRDGKAVILPGQFHQRLAGLGLDVGGVNDRQAAQGQPLASNKAKHIECIPGDGLIILVIAHHRPAGVGREDFRWQEMLARECAFARAAGADQDDEGEVGDLEVHFVRSLESGLGRHWHYPQGPLIATDASWDLSDVFKHYESARSAKRQTSQSVDTERQLSSGR